MTNERALDSSLFPSEHNGNYWSRDLLVCPECGFDHTHLRQTVVYQREEDRDTRIITIPATDGLTRGGTTANPSPRRDAVEFHFEGECGHAFTVTFIQHKGQTFVWTEAAPDDADDAYVRTER